MMVVGSFVKEKLKWCLVVENLGEHEVNQVCFSLKSLHSIFRC